MVDLRPLIKRAAILTRQLKEIRDLLSNTSVEASVIEAKLQEANILKVILHSFDRSELQKKGWIVIYHLEELSQNIMYMYVIS